MALKLLKRNSIAKFRFLWSNVDAYLQQTT